MKILFVSSGNTKFGISPFVKEQGSSLSKIGAEVNFFMINGSGKMNYLRAVPKLRKYIKKNNFDIIHAHYSYSGWVAVLAFTGLPIVLSLMGDDALGTVNSKGKVKLVSYFEIFLTKLVQPFVKQLIAKSDEIGRTVYLKKKITVIPNGVNFSHFKQLNMSECRRELNLDDDKKIILFLSDTNSPRKNYALVKEAFEIIKKKYTNIILLAPYPVPHKDVPILLNAVDVLVHTSYKEGSPNLIKEAMACNSPIVSTDVGDVRKVFGNTKGCFLTDFSSEDLALNIERGLKFGKRTTGRSDIAHLTNSVIAKQIISVYKKCIN